MSAIHLLDRCPPAFLKAPACHAGIANTFLWTRSARWTTCKGCRRTKKWRKKMNKEDAGLLCALLDHLTDGRWPEGIASFCTEYGYDVEDVRDAWERLTETADMSGPDDDDWDRVQEALDAEG